MENSKIKKPKIICERETSKFVFTVPIILSVGLLVYIINGKFDSDFFIYLLILIGITFKFFLLYYKKKFVLTNRKIYIYNKGKKFISWSLEEDFYIVNYKQSALGKIFDFGTLTLINKEKKMYEYFFIQNPKETYEIIIKSYEILMKKLDPNFIVSYNNDKDNNNIVNNIDKIDNNEK